MLGIILTAMLMSAQPAAPTTAEPAATPTPPAAAPGGPGQTHLAAAGPLKVHRDELLCKSQQVLGTLIPRKVCYTREQQEHRG